MFVALILYVGSLVAAALLPGLAIPRANVVLKTAPAAFAVLILFVGSLVAVVAVIPTVIALASAFLMIVISNGYESRVVVFIWVPMMETLLITRSQFTK